VYIERRGESYPAREEFYMAARQNGLDRVEMVGQRCGTAARQRLEGPGQGYDYQPGKGHAHGANPHPGSPVRMARAGSATAWAGSWRLPGCEALNNEDGERVYWAA
jgi:hypothetical protein